MVFAGTNTLYSHSERKKEGVSEPGNLMYWSAKETKICYIYKNRPLTEGNFLSFVILSHRSIIKVNFIQVM
jgi:hypothetical protein